MGPGPVGPPGRGPAASTGWRAWLPWLCPDDELVTDLVRPRCPGGRGRAPAGAGPGPRAPRRGGRPGRGAGRDLGRPAGRRRRRRRRGGLAPAVPPLRAIARPLGRRRALAQLAGRGPRRPGGGRAGLRAGGRRRRAPGHPGRRLGGRGVFGDPVPCRAPGGPKGCRGSWATTVSSPRCRPPPPAGRGPGWWWPRSRAGSSCPGPRWRCSPSPTSRGRRTAHRRARPRARPTDGFFDDLAPGSYVVHRQHGVARYAGITTRAIGGTTRDYLVLEYRGSDRLYLPVDQIDAVTPYSGGESPTLCRRWAGPTGSAPGPGLGRRPGRSPRSWSPSTGAGWR